MTTRKYIEDILAKGHCYCCGGDYCTHENYIGDEDLATALESLVKKECIKARIGEVEQAIEDCDTFGLTTQRLAQLQSELEKEGS